MIVTFLNGIGHLDDLKTRFGADNVLGGVVKVATHLSQAGEIVQVAPFRKPVDRHSVAPTRKWSGTATSLSASRRF
jgi:ketopantoate reductase